MLTRTLGSIGVASALCATGTAHAQEPPEAVQVRLASIVAPSLERPELIADDSVISPAVLAGSPYSRLRIPESWLPPLATKLAPARDAIDRETWEAVERRLLSIVWAPPVPSLPQLVDLPLATFVVEASQGVLFEMIDEAEPSIDDQQPVRDPKGELEWLLRQKRRSVLESRGKAPVASSSMALERMTPWIPNVSGTVEYSTTAPAVSREDVAADQGIRTRGGLLRIQGRLPNDGRWTVGGVMHESEGTSWQGHSEVVAQLFDRHEVMAATAWGSRLLTDRPEEATPALQGAVYVQDRWSVGGAWAVIGSGRYSYVGYLDQPHYFDPGVAVEWVPRSKTRASVGVRSRTLVPGGDSFALSAFVPVAGIMVNSFTSGRLGRASRLELAVDHAPGATSVGGHAFVEDVVDPSIHVLASAADPRPQSVMLGGHLHRYGAGGTIRQRIGRLASVSLSYTLGRSVQIVGPALVYAPGMPRAALPTGRYHDVIAKAETSIGATDTRVMGFARFVRHGAGSAFRYDLQLRQGVPYLPRHTGTDWTLMVALRNLFEEPRDDDALEQIVLVSPPRRVVGGVAVRF